MESPLCPPSDPGFRLIETVRWEPGKGILRREMHLARLMASAARLGIVPSGIDGALSGLSGDAPLRVRLTVDKAGRAEVTTAPFQPLPHGTVWNVAIAKDRLSSDDPWLGVKTTQRALYDTTRANLSSGVDEMLFLNENSELCEGAITNLFVDLGQGLLTPPVSCGMLPGVLRQEMIANGSATERVLTEEDLHKARALYVGNSLRGLIVAQLI